ncbi:MAG: hypothetical protein ACRCU0_05305 [Candidatus Rhabdochlamydia sp.]
MSNIKKALIILVIFVLLVLARLALDTWLVDYEMLFDPLKVTLYHLNGAFVLEAALSYLQKRKLFIANIIIFLFIGQAVRILLKPGMEILNVS